MAIETTDNSFQNKYSLVKGAARRARQLQLGAPPLMQSKSIKACRVAQDEIRQGHVTYVVRHQAVKPPIEPGI
jgi:DNA-directed RNA polymerase subunit omega